MSVVLIAFAVHATPLQNVDGLISSFSLSLTSKDASDFSTAFAKNVSLTYANVRSTYSKSHALLILNDFYDQHQPHSFKVVYKGLAPRSGAQFIVGTAETAHGPFRIYFYIKYTNGKPLIEEMKISRE